MMESILNGRRKSSQSTSIASVSIEILPEFGWSIGNERLFGPGTLFQGYVVVRCNKHSDRATRLRIHFQGVEAMLAYDVGPGVIRTCSNQLFGVRHTLWQKSDNDDDDGLSTMTTYKFLFTVQMPLVQFPPSMNHEYYRCTYKLSAYLDPSLGYGEVPVMSQIYINYIPLTETRLLKTPLYLQDSKNKKKKKKHQQTSSSLSMPSATVKLNSIEYMSGDTVRATICPIFADHHHNSSASSTALYEYHVTMNLYQISTFSADSVPIITHLVDTQSHSVASDHSNKPKEFQVGLKLKEDLPPSFEYSKIMTLGYKLKIKVYIKRLKPSLSLTQLPTNKPDGKKLREIMTILPWPSTTAMSAFETNIVIGTLSHGIRAGDDLRTYSSFRTNEVPSPQFVKSIEYQDELPRYESTRLPSYTSGTATQHCVVTGSIDMGTSFDGIRGTL